MPDLTAAWLLVEDWGHELGFVTTETTKELWLLLWKEEESGHTAVGSNTPGSP